jgi:hypothetical protein
MLYKNYLYFLTGVFLFIFSSTQATRATAPVIDGVMGFGINTTAGNCGRIIKVTNLNPSGAGSFAEAVTAEGPRIVVFEVGGVIEFDEPDWLVIEEPYLTIAGQTAPSPGITIIKGGIQIRTHDVLVQHIRVRPGDAEKVKVPWSIDAMAAVGSNAYKVIIDHCSLSWATDETLSVSGGRKPNSPHHITLSNNIVAETLYDSIHPKGGPHSRATNVVDYCKDVALIRNIYAHNNRRNPVIKPETRGVIVNNLVYDPGIWCMTTHGSLEALGYPDFPIDPPRWSIVGNRVIPGPSTHIEAIFYAWADESIDPAEIFFKDNVCDDPNILLHKGRVERLTEQPIWAKEMRVLPVEDVYDELLDHAGARAIDRDIVDSRIIQQIRDRAGGLIDSQNQVGGYPDPDSTYRALEIPSSRKQFLAMLEDMARQVEGRL